MNKVKQGLLSPSEAETVKIFVGILPKAKDYKKLQELVSERGFGSVEEAAKQLKFGSYENFMILLLNNPEVEQKARVLLPILQFGSQADNLRDKGNIWLNFADSILDNQLLKEFVQVSLAVGNQLNQGSIAKEAQAFSLESLPKLFEVKQQDLGQRASHKHLFHIVFKEWMTSKGLKSYWAIERLFSQQELKVFSQIQKLNYSETFKIADAMLLDLENVKNFM